MMHRVIFLIAIIATPVLASAAEISGTALVIDGDTLEIRGDDIRLHGIDAPEADQTCEYADGTTWSCGRRATQALHDMVSGRLLTCTWSEKDRYNRLIGTCYQDGIDLNAWLVRHGWALAYRRYSTEYAAQERTARRSRRGIWDGEFVKPWNWRMGKRLSYGGGVRDVRDRDCHEFDTQAESQAFFDQHGPRDPHRLDGDGDGHACESLQ